MNKINIIIEITCLEPGAPINGYVTLSSQTLNVNTTATYSCDRGYALVGQINRTCEDTNGGTKTNGTWSGTPPLCRSMQLLAMQIHVGFSNYTSFLILLENHRNNVHGTRSTYEWRCDTKLTDSQCGCNYYLLL